MIVLDTHVLIWTFQDDSRLGNIARTIIATSAVTSAVMVPVISAWEIALLHRDGKVAFAGGPSRWFHAAVATPGFDVVALMPDVAIDSVMMAWTHRDPADRLIVAAARQLDCALLTADATILRYAAAGHVKAIDARV